ncbi:hypothetical protein PMAYCL1PPCAC_01735, partial [Pristionchus mayeri]
LHIFLLIGEEEELSLCLVHDEEVAATRTKSCPCCSVVLHVEVPRQGNRAVLCFDHRCIRITGS